MPDIGCIAVSLDIHCPFTVTLTWSRDTLVLGKHPVIEPVPHIPQLVTANSDLKNETCLTEQASIFSALRTYKVNIVGSVKPYYHTDLEIFNLPRPHPCMAWHATEKKEPIWSSRLQTTGHCYWKERNCLIVPKLWSHMITDRERSG